ncbi:MAG: CPBP family intramembrane glutamic endopeptidase [Spirochaetaceae bacterium]
MYRSINSAGGLCKEMLLLFAVFFLPGILFQNGNVRPDAFDDPGYHFAVLVISIPQALLILHILHVRSQQAESGRPLSTFGIRAVDGGAMLKAVMAALGMFLLLALTGGVLLLLPPEIRDAFTTGLRFKVTNKALLPLALVSSLAIAYREEVFFRSYLLTRLQELGLGQPSAVLLAAGAFSLGHLYQGAGGAVVAFLLGLYLGWIFLRHRNVHVVALAHGLYNFAVLAATAAGFRLG